MASSPPPSRRDLRRATSSSSPQAATNLRSVQVGAGPDMVTFTPDGRRILVANEGEPSGYLAGRSIHAGSVSVIDVQPAQQRFR